MLSNDSEEKEVTNLQLCGINHKMQILIATCKYNALKISINCSNIAVLSCEKKKRIQKTATTRHYVFFISCFFYCASIFSYFFFSSQIFCWKRRKNLKNRQKKKGKKELFSNNVARKRTIRTWERLTVYVNWFWSV